MVEPRAALVWDLGSRAMFCLRGLSARQRDAPIAHPCPGLQVPAQLSQLGSPRSAGSPEGSVPKPLICAQRCELSPRLSGVDKHLVWTGISFQLFSIQSKHFQALSYLAISSLYLNFLFPHQQLQHEAGQEQV